MVRVKRDQPKKGDIVKFYPYCPGIPWIIPNGKTKPRPRLSYDLWQCKIGIPKNNKNIICGGGIFECLVATVSKKILNTRGVKVNEWLVPDYCIDAMNIFDTDVSKPQPPICELHDDIIDLKKISKDFPIPIFFNIKSDVYFNLLLNYGNSFETDDNNDGGGYGEIKPFYSQILDNLCIKMIGTNSLIGFVPIQNKEFTFPAYDFLNSKNIPITINENYYIIDQSCVFQKNINDSMNSNKSFVMDDLAKIAKKLNESKTKCIIMTDNPKLYKGENIYTIPAWDNINSKIVCSLLYAAKGLVSSDPQMYLTAGLFNTPKIFCTEKQLPGFTFDDIIAFTKTENKKNKWFEVGNCDVKEIINKI